MRVALIARAAAVFATLGVTACAPPSGDVPSCRRVEGVVLTRENGFAAIVASDPSVTIDAEPERINVAMTVMRPLHGAIELVHVAGDREAARWRLVPAGGSSPVVGCTIGLGARWSNCHARVREVPHPVGGYYYLQAHGNTVLEASVSFVLCD